MICPVCKQKLVFNDIVAICNSNHAFPVKNEAYQIQTPEFKAKLDVFLTAFEASRKNRPTFSIEVLNNLPYTVNDGEWKLKQDDLNLIKTFGLSNGKALDVGCWNGWLSNQLVNLGLEVEAYDTFISNEDGLGVKKHYKNDWRTYQMRLDQIQLFEESFDLIVFNRNVGYFEDLEKALVKAKSLLKPNGILLLTGVNYIKNPDRIILGLERSGEEFQKKYNTSFFLYDFDGYFSDKAMQLIKTLNIQLKLYPTRKLASFKNKFFPAKPIYFYGIYRNEGRV